MVREPSLGTVLYDMEIILAPHMRGEVERSAPTVKEEGEIKAGDKGIA